MKACINGFTAAIQDDQLPFEREKLGRSAKGCVCKEIKILKDFMGEDIPDELREIWKARNCDDFFKPKSGIDLDNRGQTAEVKPVGA